MTTKTSSSKVEEMAAYEGVHYKDSYGTLFVSDVGIRFLSDNKMVGLILLPDELVNVSISSFPVQNLFLLNVSSFSQSDEETFLNSFQMAKGVDMVRAKDKIDTLLNRRGRRALPCNVAERLAERQEAAFYSF